MNPYSPDDRPAPDEQPLRARVPDKVAGGAFSTGVIVMTAQTEFILDFVQNLGRPHQVVARVVMPHAVLPQLADALYRNIELYRSRWGELPSVPDTGSQHSGPPASGPAPSGMPASAAGDASGAGGWGVQYAGLQQDGPAESVPEDIQGDAPSIDGADAGQGRGPATSGSVGQGNSGSPMAGDANSGAPEAVPGAPLDQTPEPTPEPTPGQTEPKQPGGGAPHGPGGGPGIGARQATAQEVYDDLKIRDEILSGSYANAVMIGHGPHEFSFDFITNFYPHSAVSARVFLAAGQVPRLFDSLKGTWEQMQARMRQQGRPGNPPPGSSPPGNPPPGGGGDGFGFPDFGSGSY